MEREPIRACLAKAGMTVKRKNAAQDPPEPHIVLAEVGPSAMYQGGGVKITVGGAVDRPEVVNAMAAKANLTLQTAGYRINVINWDAFTVVGHDA